MPILQQVQGDVLESGLPIVFAVNSEGINDGGFAGVISRREWPILASIGPCEMGAVLPFPTDKPRLYALVCHSLDSGEWDLAAITAGLDKIADERGDQDEVAVVWMGRGFVGRLSGVDPEDTRRAVEGSRLRTHLYYI